MFVELLKKYREQYDIKIFAYVLMPDHLHLLIELKGAAQRGAPANPTGPGAAQRGAPANPIGPGGEAEPAKTQELSEFMHGLNNAYTKYFNGRYERKGHLFRERFKAAIVERDNYLLKMTVYLHLNPQKLNLVSNASAYPYSSYAAYTGTDQAHAPGQQAGQGADTASFGGLDLRNEVAEILTLLGTKSYVQYVNEMNAEDAAFLQKRLSRGGIIGSDDFVRRVREQASVYQSQPQAAEQEISTQRHWRVFVTTGGLVLIAALTVGGGLFYLAHKRTPPHKTTKPATTVLAITTPEDLNRTEWQLRLVPLAGGKEASDTMTFKDGKIISARFDLLGFGPSNYSITQAASGALVWETMQSADGVGTVSWHGEVEKGKMQGVVSLRLESKEPQDYSFVSPTFTRKE